ncbi:MAG: hypothetical protein ACM3ZC_09595 [Bacteroidota bacterium]
MSLFISPIAKEQIPERTSLFKGLAGLELARQCALLLALIGTLGVMFHLSVLGLFRQTPFSAVIAERAKSLMQPAFLSVWLLLCLLGLSAAVISSSLSGRMAAKRGGLLIERLRDIPAERSLLTILEKMPDTHVIVQPTLRLGGAEIKFDLATVSVHGLSFFRASAGDMAEIDAVKHTLTHLSEQYGIPLLARARFFLFATGLETKSVQGWQTCTTGDIGRFFQRVEGSTGAQELAKCFRALYSLALPANMPPIPIEGTVPSNYQLAAPGATTVVHKHEGVERLVKVLFFGLLAICLAIGSLYALQFFQYEMAEGIMRPTRAFLRAVLPPDWQDRLALGTEINIGESHIYATPRSDTPIRLSTALGRRADGPEVPAGAELRIIQAKISGSEEWYLISSSKGAGWLPGTELTMRHLVVAGTPLYDRPQPNASILSTVKRDSPVALLSVWHRPSRRGEIVWSKICFLDKTIGYIQGEI